MLNSSFFFSAHNQFVRKLINHHRRLTKRSVYLQTVFGNSIKMNTYNSIFSRILCFFKCVGNRSCLVSEMIPYL